MSEKKKNDGFIMQAGILAGAGILSRIIGLLYNAPMTAIIGDEGNGYYEFAYRAYTVVLLISSYSIPSAISKVIASHLAKGEYRNAQRIFHGAIFYVCLVGGAAAILVFFFADMIVNLENAGAVLRYFAPTIFLSGLLGVFRGYFQAYRTMAQTSVSQVLEQVVHALASIMLAIWMVGLVPEPQATEDVSSSIRSVNGAIGAAIGTGIGVVVALLFMWVIYTLNRKTINARIKRDKTRETLAYGAILKMILLVVTPFILSTCIYNVNTFLNQSIFVYVMKLKDYADAEVAVLISAVGKAMKVSNIPIAIASAMSAAILPSIAGDYALGRLDLCREKVSQAVRAAMFIAIPSGAGIAVLARPIMMLLYPQEATLDLSSSLLSVLAVGVVFYSLSTLSSAVLQGTAKKNRPVINAAVALVIQTVLLVVGLNYTDLGPYAMAVCVVVFAFVMCVLNGMAVRKHLEYREEWERAFFRPLVISLVMGAAVFGSYYGIYYLSSINILSLLIAVAFGVTIYFTLAVRWRVLGKEELGRFIKSKWLLNVVNMISEE